MVSSLASRQFAHLIPAVVSALFVPPLLALVASCVLVALLVHSRAATFALDHPNQRSLHVTPTPRTGGLGIIAGVAAAWAYAQPAIDPGVLAALGLLIGVSLFDDLRGANPGWRLFVHLVGALLAAAALVGNGEWWLLALIALSIAWMTNLYNFMDGADGLAGGMTVIGFGSYGLAACAGGDFSFASINLSVAFAALGFLMFNFPPARIFMGDAGAIPLGFLAAVFNVAGWLRGDWPCWFGIAVFSPFIVDASVTLLKRLARGAKVWQAHREHFYQRLVQSGWGHRRTVYAEYTLMLICSLAAMAAMRQQPAIQIAVLGGLVALYSGLLIALERGRLRHAAA